MTATIRELKPKQRITPGKPALRKPVTRARPRGSPLRALKSTPVVFLCHPASTFGTARGAMLADTALLELEGCEVIDPEQTPQQYRGWSTCLRVIAGLVAFGDEESAIGARSFIEVTDALRMGLPVAVLADDLTLRHLDSLKMVAPAQRTPERMAELVPGTQVSPAMFLAATRRLGKLPPGRGEGSGNSAS